MNEVPVSKRKRTQNIFVQTGSKIIKVIYLKTVGDYIAYCEYQN